jgi:hypothetical protein
MVTAMFGYGESVSRWGGTKIILRFLWAAVLVPALAAAAPLDLPRDADGWTVFTPSADSRIVYISQGGSDASGQVYAPTDAAIGGDPFNPVGAVNAFETYAAAYALTRSGSPDWILLRRGDEFTFSLGSSIHSGRATNEPFLIGAYGPSGRCPVVKTGSNQAFGLSDLQYFALFGIDFYAHTRDPDGPDYVDGTGSSGFRLVAGSGHSLTGVLFEGSKFRFYQNNSVQKYLGTATGDFNIRRCLFTDNYSESSHSQGLYTSGVDGFTLEENIFIHNGWYTQQLGGGNEQDGGQATMFNHNTYFTDGTNVTFSENMFLIPSSCGTKWTANDGFVAENIILDNNLFVDGEVAIGMGGNTTEPLRFKNPIVRNNVITNIGRSQPTGRTLGWGIGAEDWDGGVMANNLLMNQPFDAITNTYGINLVGTLRNVSITGNIIHNIRFADGLNLSDGRGNDVAGMLFSENKIQISRDAGYAIDAEYDPADGWVFSDNIYYSDRPEGSRLRMAGTQMSLAQWQAASGDNSTFESHPFPDPDRDIEGYQASLGQPASIDVFIAACRDQDRFSWDPRYTAGAVNAWIKAGFALSSSSADGSGNNGGPVITGGGNGSSGGGSGGGCFVRTIGQAN